MALMIHYDTYFNQCDSFSFNSLHFDYCLNDTGDYDDYPFINDLWYVKSWWEITLKVVLFLPVTIGGIVGNAAILNAVRKNRVLRLAPLNIYIANMAACDLCALLIGPWLLMCIDSFQNFVLGAFFCKTEGFIQSSLLLGGVFSLMAISGDRFVAIVFPKKKKSSVTMAWCVVAATWLLGISISVPLIIYRHYNERQWANFLEKYCTEDSEVLSVYWYVMIALLVWLPLLVMLICYFAIFLKLTHYARQARKSTVNPSRDFRTRVTRMVLLLVLVFIVCRVPFTALIYVRNALQHNFSSQNQIGMAFRVLWFVAHFLMYANAAINPVIYGMTNDGFRRAIHQAYPCLSSPSKGQSVQEGQQQPTGNPSPAGPAKVLEPREPYHVEPCWRPNSIHRSQEEVGAAERKGSVFTVGNSGGDSNNTPAISFS